MHGKRLVISIIIFLSCLLFTLDAVAMDCNWVEEAEGTYLKCGDVVYATFTIEESIDILKKVSNHDLVVETNLELKNKIKLQDKLLDKKDDMISILQDSGIMDKQLIDKLLVSPYNKQKFWQKPSTNFILGMLFSSASYTAWQFTRDLEITVK